MYSRCSGVIGFNMFRCAICRSCRSISDRIVGDVCFFFQAEDGIRDLVRSRGLGDVYKRQRKARSPGRPGERVRDSRKAKSTEGEERLP